MAHAQSSDEETGLLLPFNEGGGESEQGFDGLEEALENTPFAESPENVESGRGELLNGPTLRPGSTGKYVSMLQQALVKLGHAVRVTGKFDAETARALRNFQSRQGLTADGVAGPQTKGAIVRALGGSAPRPGRTG